MANLRLVFANEFEIAATDCGIVPHVVAEYDTAAEALAAVEAITEDGALDKVQAFKDDLLLMEWEDVNLDGFQGVINDVVTLHLYMQENGERTGATEEDLEKAKAYDILFGMEDEEEDEE